MKRGLSFFLCALLLCSLLPGRAAAAEEISITTRQELEAIRQDPSASYRLDADIDLGEGDWLPIPLTGTLNGNGHTLYNLRIRSVGEETAQTVDGNHKTYDTRLAGLFSAVTGGEIRDLNILGADLQVTSQDHCFAGILAGAIADTTIRNCSVSGRAGLYTTGVMVGLGGIAGFGLGTIENCSVEAELTFADRRDPENYPRCEQFMGGILACGNCTMNGNTVKLRGYDSCWGYVHNGGIVGLHYRYNWEDPVGEICGNRVEGTITFFENNPDRRAYCQAIGGEVITESARIQDNEENFHRDERFQQTRELKAHSCEKEDFEEIPVAHTGEDFGYTLCRCRTCGYEYRKDYMAPGHKPGDWEILEEPDYEKAGQRQCRCTLCGEVAVRETIPQKIPAGQCILSQTELKLNYRDSGLLTARLLPETVTDPGVLFESEDPQVASVDGEGRVQGLKRGSTRILCRSADGFASQTCQVTVGYSPLQWVIEILLFGWIWY